MTGNSNKELKDNIGIKLTFLMNEQPSFTWNFLQSHFDVNPILNTENSLSFILHDPLLSKYNQGLSTYLMNFYIDDEYFEECIQVNSNLTWSVIYSGLENEKIKKAAITYIFKNKQRAHYSMAWHWMNQMPTTDRRIQLFILDRLLMDRSWYDNLPATAIIKQQAETYLSEIKNTEINEIVKSNFWALLRLSNERKIIIFNQSDIYQYDWINMAALNGQLDIVKVLVENGADVDVKDADNNTALHNATLRGHLEIVKLLIENSADVNAQDNDDQTALHIAAEFGYLEIVKRLIENGADINHPDDDLVTPLHNAAEFGCLETVKWLIANGADVNVKDDIDRTVLSIAKTDSIKDYLQNI